VIQDVLTMIPGPTPVHERVLDALARPTTSHQDPRFVALFRRCLESLNVLAATDRAQPVVVAGSGTLAMEMALVNLLGDADRLLVLSQGYFGDRWAEIAAAFGTPVELVRAEWGEAIPPERLAGLLANGRYSAVAMTHVDTSTGAAAPIAAYCEILRGRDELVVLDGVCATGALDEPFDAWGLDVLVTGAQKALGAPPGLAILWLAPRALERRRARGRIPAYAADLERWLPIMSDPSRYFSTPPVNEIVALDAALGIALEEGRVPRFARHARLAAALRAGLAGLGLTPFTSPSWLADTLSVVLHPEGIADSAFRAAMATRGVFVAGGIGPLAGRCFRIGHMGNIASEEVCRVLHVVERSLADLGIHVRDGAALAAAAPVLAGQRPATL
jgi:aspartate aminotransferase-like enzyme